MAGGQTGDHRREGRVDAPIAALDDDGFGGFRTSPSHLEDYFAGVHGWSGLGANTLVPGENLSITLSAAAIRTAVFSDDLQAVVVFSVHAPVAHESVAAGNSVLPNLSWEDSATKSVNWQVPAGEFDGQKMPPFLLKCPTLGRWMAPKGPPRTSTMS